MLSLFFRKISIFGYWFNLDWVVILTIILLLSASLALKFKRDRLAYGLLVIAGILLAYGFYLHYLKGFHQQ